MVNLETTLQEMDQPSFAIEFATGPKLSVKLEKESEGELISLSINLQTSDEALAFPIRVGLASAPLAILEQSQTLENIGVTINTPNGREELQARNGPIVVEGDFDNHFVNRGAILQELASNGVAMATRLIDEKISFYRALPSTFSREVTSQYMALLHTAIADSTYQGILLQQGFYGDTKGQTVNFANVKKLSEVTDRLLARCVAAEIITREGAIRSKLFSLDAEYFVQKNFSLAEDVNHVSAFYVALSYIARGVVNSTMSQVQQFSDYSRTLQAKPSKDIGPIVETILEKIYSHNKELDQGNQVF